LAVHNNSRENGIFIRQKAYNAILRLLNPVIGGRDYPDIHLSELFKKEEFSSDEKAAITGIVYGVLRHLGRLDYIIGNASNVQVSNIRLDMLNIFRICTYQTVFMSASPAGIINNAVALSSREAKLGGFVKRTVEGILRNKDVIYPDRDKNPVEHISVYHSHPQWIVEKWLREFNDIETVEALCRVNNLEPPLTIRTNLLRTERRQLQKLLLDEGYRSTSTIFSPFGLIVDRKEGIFRTEAFRGGLFEVQDEGSQLITLLAGAKPGERVIDACAGNGGKSLFLSGLMKAQGTVIAMDIHAGKLANLKRRAERGGASNIRIMMPDGAKLRELTASADCVLIDAPCSGMGVFRRNPDAKWRLKEKDIRELAAKQGEIIREYSVLVKPGGRLVYATCTISREENEDIVRAFLEENEGFYVVPAAEMSPGLFGEFTTGDGFFRALPHVHGTDGFFGAVMRRASYD